MNCFSLELDWSLEVETRSRKHHYIAAKMYLLKAETNKSTNFASASVEKVDKNGQGERWTDNIKDWMKMSLAECVK